MKSISISIKLVSAVCHGSYISAFSAKDVKPESKYRNLQHFGREISSIRARICFQKKNSPWSTILLSLSKIAEGGGGETTIQRNNISIPLNMGGSIMNNLSSA